MCYILDRSLSILVRSLVDCHYPFSWQILKAMGLTKAASSAVNLLIEIGYFPVHVNLDLLKMDINTLHLDEVTSAATSLLSESDDPDAVSVNFFFPLDN